MEVGSLTNRTSALSTDEDGSFDVTTGAFVAGGVTLLSVCVLAVCALCRSRRHARKSGSEDDFRSSSRRQRHAENLRFGSSGRSNNADESGNRRLRPIVRTRSDVVACAKVVPKASERPSSSSSHRVPVLRASEMGSESPANGTPGEPSEGATDRASVSSMRGDEQLLDVDGDHASRSSPGRSYENGRRRPQSTSGDPFVGSTLSISSSREQKLNTVMVSRPSPLQGDERRGFKRRSSSGAARTEPGAATGATPRDDDDSGGSPEMVSPRPLPPPLAEAAREGTRPSLRPSLRPSRSSRSVRVGSAVRVDGRDSTNDDVRARSAPVFMPLAIRDPAVVGGTETATLEESSRVHLALAESWRRRGERRPADERLDATSTGPPTPPTGDGGRSIPSEWVRSFGEAEDGIRIVGGGLSQPSSMSSTLDGGRTQAIRPYHPPRHFETRLRI